MDRVYNFSAGPSTLPLPVLEKAKSELINARDSGMSVMEMSHRSKEYLEIISQAEELLRELMNIPSNYKVLFLQGGASLQFSMVPLNLFRNSKKADFVNTGQWSKKAIAEAKRFGDINVIASSEDKMFTYIPELRKENFSSDADYFHITPNNTIYGSRYNHIPDTGDVPLVADMSSCILSEEYDISKFGIIYAGAQKNIGPAGLTVVIVREDLIGHADETTPVMLDYKTHADKGSMYNTPPTYGIYIAMLVFEWLSELGGLKAIEEYNIEKATMLYDYIDNSDMFKGTVVKQDRSRMNVPFILPNDELNKEFIRQATTAGFVNLGGHRSVGGMRASMYNAMPIEGVKALIEFMKNFEHENSL